MVEQERKKSKYIFFVWNKICLESGQLHQKTFRRWKRKIQMCVIKYHFQSAALPLCGASEEEEEEDRWAFDSEPCIIMAFITQLWRNRIIPLVFSRKWRQKGKKWWKSFNENRAELCFAFGGDWFQLRTDTLLDGWDRKSRPRLILHTLPWVQFSETGVVDTRFHFTCWQKRPKLLWKTTPRETIHTVLTFLKEKETKNLF